MKPDDGQDQDAAFPGSMEAGAASGNIAACRAQAELVEALARLVLDSVSKKVRRTRCQTRPGTAGHQQSFSKVAPRWSRGWWWFSKVSAKSRR
jgi:hypothetical protein